MDRTIKLSLLLLILQAVVTVVTTAVAAAILLVNAPREGVTGEADEAVDEEDGVGEIVTSLVMTWDTDFGNEKLIIPTPPLLV